MLKPNKINLARQLKAPVRTAAAGRPILWLPVAVLVLLAVCALGYVTLTGRVLESRLADLEAGLLSPDAVAGYQAAEADIEAHAALVARRDHLAALADNLDSYNSDYLGRHQQALYAEANRLGVRIERLSYDWRSGLLTLECMGAQTGSAADLAAGLTGIHDILAIDYGGYSRAGTGYRFTLSCAINNINQ